MDLLISNQSDSRFESFLLIGIFYIQIISSFFSESLNVFTPENAKSDKLLSIIEKIISLKIVYQNNFVFLKVIEIILFILIIILIVHFLILVILISKNSSYSYNKKIINSYIKIFFYIGYNIIFDICFSIISINTEELKPKIKIEKSSSNYFALIIISIIIIVLALFFMHFF